MGPTCSPSENLVPNSHNLWPVWPMLSMDYGFWSARLGLSWTKWHWSKVANASQFFLCVCIILKPPLLVLLGDLWHREFIEESGSPKSHLDQRDKVEAWLLKQQATMESSSDASSTDTNNWSDCNDNFRKPYRRPALVRTKTERITLFDDFFDKEII